MKNIRAIASIMIIIGSVPVQTSYKLLSDVATDDQFRYGLIQNLLPALVGFILIHNGVKGLLSTPDQSK